MDEFRLQLRPNPEKNASLISRLFFCFINPLLRLGYKRPLETADLYHVLDSEDSEKLCAVLEKAWQAERTAANGSNRKPRLRRAIVAVFGKRFMAAGLVPLLEELLKLLQAVFMAGIIRYFRPGSTVSTAHAYIFAAGLTFCALALAVAHHPYFYYIQRIGMRVRLAVSGLLYKKSLTLSSAALKQVTVGKIVNLLSSDVGRFDQYVMFLHFAWAAPVSLIGYIILLWYIMGPSCLAGVLCLLLLVPLQGVIGSRAGKYRRKVAALSDKRIGIMNEILNGIRVIKMYAWERPFSLLVDRARMQEIKKLRVQAFLMSLIMGLFFISGKLIVLFAIVAYVLEGRIVNAEVIFVSSALFNAARLTVTLFLPFAIQFLADARVTLGRIEDFLLLEDKQLPALMAPKTVDSVGTEARLPYIDEKLDEEAKRSTRNLAMSKVKIEEAVRPLKSAGEEAYVRMTNYSAKWDQDQPTLTLDSINFSVNPGQLTIIVGPVGAGKSSILLSLLGETVGVSGRVDVHGTVAYVPQEPWIFSATLRRNVTFGAEIMDTSKYQRALTVCALKKDVEIMPHGDITIIGDRGVGLSGGQRARVNLARAVYSDADIYLLDDPLSAVDSTVGRYIFDRCIRGHLRRKPVVLVTHQLQYLPSADQILVMREGKVVASGTFEHLQNLGDEFTAILRECEESYKRRDSITSAPTKPSRRKFSSQASRTSRKDSGRLTSTSSTASNPARQNSVPVTSSPKAGQKSVPKLDFNSPGTDKDGRNFHETDSYRRAISRNTTDSVEKTEETEALLEKSLDGDLTQELGKGGDTGSAWSLDAVEVPVPQPEEDRSIGVVSWRVYYEYFRAMANCLVVVLLLVFCLLVQVIFNFSDWWLNVWTTQAEYEERIKSLNGSVDPASIRQANITVPSWWLPGVDQLTSDDCLKIYAGMTVLLLILSLARSVIFRYMLTRSSFQLHSRMFRAIIRTRVAFFDRNPIGRILNRFSKDTNTMDEMLAFVTFDFIQGAMSFLGIVIVVCLVNPWIFIPTLPLLCSFIAVPRSPIYSHVSATLNGLTTIRAFGASANVISDFHRYQNIHSAAFGIFLSSSRWFAIFIDWLCASFICIVAFVSIFTADDQNAGETGMILLYSMSLTFLFGYFVNQTATMEYSMVSVERILEYSKLRPEATLDKHGSEKIPLSWPDKGEIIFDHVSLKYSDDGQNVLHDISFVIKPAEKIGIVGRTGAGKSSLLTALYRLSEPDGTIMIDGQNIKTVELSDLRKRISIIPQDPVLFIGTLRENLDPFVEFDDYRIWQALEQVELRSAVDQMPQRLSTPMQEGGANLSIGQRQLVCLARALLRRNKILVIDEATANVDLHTDALIQRTLRYQFKECTVLTIAHRLNTIMDSSRIIVLQDGRIAEFDSPSALLRRRDSAFSKLVHETGETNAQLLTSLAEEAQAMNQKNGV